MLPGKLPKPLLKKPKPVAGMVLRRAHKRHYRPVNSFPTLVGLSSRVKNPKQFGGQFALNARVLELHFQANKQKSLGQLVKLLGEKIIELKMQGVMGVFGDTQNNVLAKKLLERFGGVAIDSPPVTQKRARAQYKLNEKRFGYDPKYRDAPVRRIIIKF